MAKYTIQYTIPINYVYEKTIEADSAEMAEDIADDIIGQATQCQCEDCFPNHHYKLLQGHAPFPLNTTFADLPVEELDKSVWKYVGVEPSFPGDQYVCVKENLIKEYEEEVA
jgi:hypothetical protein